MRLKKGKRICSLLLACFLLLGSIPVQSFGQIEPLPGDDGGYTVFSGEEHANNTPEEINEPGGPDDETGENTEPGGPDENEENGGTGENTEPGGPDETGENGGTGENTEPGGPDETGENGEAGENTEPGGRDENEETEESEEPEEEPEEEVGEPEEHYIITAIDFDYDNARIEAPLGTQAEELGLPETLAVTAANARDEIFNTELEVAWSCENYNPDALGEYEFSAVLPESWALADDVRPPVMTVQLIMPIMALNDPMTGFSVYSGGPAGTFLSSHAAFNDAWTALRNTGSADTINMYVDGTLSLATGQAANQMNKSATINGNGRTLTVPQNNPLATLDTLNITLKDITIQPAAGGAVNFRANVRLDNATFVFPASAAGNVLSATAIYVISPSTIRKPTTTSLAQFFTLNGPFANGRPIDGGMLNLESTTGTAPNIDVVLAVFNTAVTAADANLVLNENIGLTNLAGCAPTFFASGSTYQFRIAQADVMLISGNNRTGYRNPDAFDNAVSAVSVNDSTIMLYTNQTGSTGNLPTARTTITSAPGADATLTRAGGFTLSTTAGADITFQDITVSSPSFALNGRTLTIGSGTIFSTASNITGGGANSGTLTINANPGNIGNISNLTNISVNAGTGAIGDITGVTDVSVNAAPDSMGGISAANFHVSAGTFGSPVSAGAVAVTNLNIGSGIATTGYLSSSGNVTAASDITFAENSGIAASGNVNATSGDITLAGNSSITANDVVCGGTLGFGSGGAAITAQSVTAGTLTGTGAIRYNGAGSPAATPILSLGSSGIGAGSVTISYITAAPVNGDRIIRVPKGTAIDTASLTLSGAAFDNFALRLDDTQAGFDYYVLQDVEASLTYGGTTIKYTTFRAAAEALDALSDAQAATAVINLWQPNVTGTFPGTANPARTANIVGQRPAGAAGPAGPYTLTFGGAVNRNVMFSNIRLNVTGTALDAGAHTLTIGADTALTDAAKPLAVGTGTLAIAAGFTCGAITGTGPGTLTVTGSALTCGAITDVGTVTLQTGAAVTSGGMITGATALTVNGSTLNCSGIASAGVAITNSTVNAGTGNITGTGTFTVNNTGGQVVTCGQIGGFSNTQLTAGNITLDRLTVSGAVTAATSAALTFRGSDAFEAYIMDLSGATDITGFAGLRMTTAAAGPGDYLVKIPDNTSETAGQYKTGVINRIQLLGGYSQYMLRWQNGTQYFTLAPRVANIGLSAAPVTPPSIPADTYTYGDAFVVTAALRDASNNPITGWTAVDGAVVQFSIDGTLVGPPVNVDTGANNGTATITLDPVADAALRSRLSARTTPHEVSVVFYNEPPTGGAAAGSLSITINKKPLGLIAAAVDTSAFSKPYDGLPSLPDGALAALNAIDRITVDSDDLLPGDLVNTAAEATIAAFTDDTVNGVLAKDAGQNKPVTVTGVTIGGADAGNYEPVLADITSVPTSWSITPKQLEVNEAEFAGLNFDKVYDGNADVYSGLKAALTHTPLGVAAPLGVPEDIQIVPTSFADDDAIVYVDADGKSAVNAGGWDIWCANGWTLITSGPAGNYTAPEPGKIAEGTIERRMLHFSVVPGTTITKPYDNDAGLLDEQLALLTTESASPAITVDAAASDPPLGSTGLVGGDSVVISAATGSYTIGASGPNAGTYEVEVTFRLADESGNYKISDNGDGLSLTRTGLDGEITKATVTISPDPLVIEIASEELGEAGAADLGEGTGFTFAPISGGMEAGELTFANITVDEEDPANFFSVGPAVAGGSTVLTYTPDENLTEDSYAKVTLDITSQNYKPATGDIFTDITLEFSVVSRVTLTISGMDPPSSTVYGDPLPAPTGEPVFAGKDGVVTPPPFTAGELVYYYLNDDTGDDTIYLLPGAPPKNRGTYTLYVQVPDGDQIYRSEMTNGRRRGTAQVQKLEITRRPITVKPGDVDAKYLDIAELDTTTGAPLAADGTAWPSAWDSFDDFVITGLAYGEDPATAFGAVSFPFAVEAPDLNAASQDIVMTNAPAFTSYPDVGDNYAITAPYGTGRLTINKEADEWFAFIPESPSLPPLWNNAPITAKPSGDSPFRYIRVDSGDYQADPGGYDGNLNVQSGGMTVSLYLSSDEHGALATEPLEFTYKLDTAPPVLGSDVSFLQTSRDYGILRVTATDALSGVAKVGIEVENAFVRDGPGAYVRETTMIHKGGGVYECAIYGENLDAPFTYEITAADNAGNETAPLDGDEFTIYDFEISVTDSAAGQLPDGGVWQIKADGSPDSINLVAAIAHPDPLPDPNTLDLTFTWAVTGSAASGFEADNENITITLAELEGGLAKRAAITVSVMGKDFTVRLSIYSEEPVGGEDDFPGVTVNTEDDGEPEFIYADDEEDVPAGNNIVLMIEELEATLKLDLQGAMIARWTKPVLDAEWPNWNQPGNSWWYDIYLADASDNNRRVKAVNATSIAVRLPHPAGIGEDHEYMVVHGIDESLQDLSGTIYKHVKGISFEVGSFSPFAVIWKTPEPPLPPPPPPPGPDSPPSNPSGPKPVPFGLFGSAALERRMEDFWYQVRFGITWAKPGDTVTAHVPYNFTTIPVSVLRVLQGKDVTLTVKWQGRVLHIYGKDVKLPGLLDFTHYTLEELFRLYGGAAVPEEPRGPNEPEAYAPNPSTGGDGVMIAAPDGRIVMTLPAVPEISVAAPPRGIKHPELPPAAPAPDAFEAKPAGLPEAPRGGAAPNAAAENYRFNSLNFIVIGLSILLFSALLVTIGLRHATMPDDAIPDDIQDIPVQPVTPQAAPVQAAGPAPPAPEQAKPDKIQAMIRPKAAPVVKTPERIREDKTFINMIALQKLLKQDLENGVITKDEYERQKMRLMYI